MWQAGATADELEDYEEANAIRQAQREARKRQREEQGGQPGPSSKRTPAQMAPSTPVTAAPKGPLAQWLVRLPQS